MTQTNKPSLVYIVDDDADVRASLSMLLDSVDIDIETYPDADSFIRSYVDRPETACCLLLDVRMPGLSGMAVLENLHQQNVRLPVIILTGHGDIPMSVRAMKLGAVDFITKPFNHQKLLDLVQNVLRDPVLQGIAPSAKIDPKEARMLWETLSPREKEIFSRIVNGASNEVIGIDLGISIRTVETHRARIMEKLKARTLVDLVMLSLSLDKSS
jgi:two-component system, LuxR family, response regulator FixJ